MTTLEEITIIRAPIEPLLRPGPVAWKSTSLATSIVANRTVATGGVTTGLVRTPDSASPGAPNISASGTSSPRRESRTSTVRLTSRTSWSAASSARMRHDHFFRALSPQETRNARRLQVSPRPCRYLERSPSSYSSAATCSNSCVERNAALKEAAGAMKIVIPGGLAGRSATSSRDTSERVATMSLSSATPRTPENAWADALADADVCINLAGRSVNCRYHAANRRAIFDSRLHTTRLLNRVIATLPHPPSVWLNASTATIYRHALDRPMDEFTGELGGGEAGAPDTWNFSIAVAKAWEQAFFETPTLRTRKVAMRSAITLSPDRTAAFSTCSSAWFVTVWAERRARARSSSPGFTSGISPARSICSLPAKTSAAW